MLHWLAGKQAPEGPSDSDATGYLEPPETPAPVFAVRAFKQAIFGTPQTTAPKPRRNSNHERDRHRPVSPNKRSRPELTRPKSANDAPTLAKQDSDPEPMASPTKGILMTPGTAAARRKTVSFGDHVVDNKSKKPVAGSKSGLPNDFPGKYPSPWADKPTNEEAQSKEEGRGRKSKLTEELEKVRDSSAKPKRGKALHEEAEHDETMDLAEPVSESGKYWKHEYDLYREKTQHEVKKLVLKQKAAKNYARDKDMACTELAEQLRQEKKRADKLEKRAEDLKAKVKELEARLQEVNAKPDSTEAREQAIRTRSKPSQPKHEPSAPSESRARPPQPVAASDAEAPLSEEKAIEPDAAVDALVPQQAQSDLETRPQPQEGLSSSKLPNAEKPSAKWGAMDTKYRRRPERLQAKSQADIWTQGVDSSGLSGAKGADAPSVSPRGGRAVTSGTDATPLKSLSINALPAAQAAVREASPKSPEDARQPRPRFTTRYDSGSPLTSHKRKDSFEVSIDAPQPSAQPQQHEQDPLRDRFDALKKIDGSPSRDIACLPPPSSPFQPEATAMPTNTEAKLTTTFAATTTAASKENVSPSSKSHALAATNKPATLVIGAKRVISKDGKDLPNDRVAAAKARIEARNSMKAA